MKKETKQRDQFAEFIGIELLSVSPGHAKVKMEIKPNHLNGLDLVHGAAIFGLADYAFAAASNSHGTAAVGINVSVSYMKAAHGEGVLYAEATEVSKNRKLGTYLIDVTNNDNEKIAVMMGTVYRKKEENRMFIMESV